MENIVFALLSGLALVLIIFLLNFYIKWKAYGKKEALLNRKKKENEKRRNEASLKGLLVNCPLCSSPLLPGEDLITRIYRPMNVPDQLCTINGCPHCYPVPQNGIERKCPVCHKTVPLKDGHLTARLFNRANGKKHVLITGCTECCSHSPQ